MLKFPPSVGLCVPGSREQVSGLRHCCCFCLFWVIFHWRWS